MKKQNGFTLVELAIVLMIIGLLIGGILRGQELMNNARVTSTVQQVNAYQGAWHTFTDAYNSYPGDIATAANKLPGCQTGNNNQCQNGNGDGLINSLGGVADYPYNNIPNGIATENTQAWKHLALAHLISGVDPSATTPDWGKTFPAAKIGGGFFIRYGNINIINTMVTSGNFFVLRGTVSGNWICGPSNNGACSVSPQRASQMDRKMDDGIAMTGSVYGVSSNWNEGCGPANLGTNGPNGYNETNDVKNCDLMFRI